MIKDQRKPEDAIKTAKAGVAKGATKTPSLAQLPRGHMRIQEWMGLAGGTQPQQLPDEGKTDYTGYDKKKSQGPKSQKSKKTKYCPDGHNKTHQWGV